MSKKDENTQKNLTNAYNQFKEFEGKRYTGENWLNRIHFIIFIFML